MQDAPPRHRLFVEAALSAHAEIELGEQQAHYLIHVMRLGIGAEVALFNGRDGEWRSRITETGKRKVRLKATHCLRPQEPEPDLWLLFAPVKRARIDLIVEKATELGVSRLQPVFTERTVMSRVGDDRLRAIAIEAAEQCERLTVPELAPACPLWTAFKDWPEERPLLLLDESGAGRPIAEVLAAMSPGPAALLIGPEGGFAESELDGLGRLAFSTRVGMGRRILRADTAVIAALACFQAICGDWRRSPQ